MHDNYLLNQLSKTGKATTKDYRLAQETYYYLVNQYPFSEFELIYNCKKDLWTIKEVKTN